MTTACLTIAAAVSKAASGDTIVVVTGSYAGATIGKNIRVTGDSDVAALVLLNGGRTQLVFTITAGTTVEIGNLTIQTGYSTTSTGGGGVANSGTLTLNNVVVRGNLAYYPGGGISNGGSLSLSHSTVSGNEAHMYQGIGGGGIYNFGTMTIADTIISNNVVNHDYRGLAAGIHNSGTLTITRSVIRANSARDMPPEMRSTRSSRVASTITCSTQATTYAFACAIWVA